MYQIKKIQTVKKLRKEVVLKVKHIRKLLLRQPSQETKKIIFLFL